jgi:hypothetical protein
VLVLFPITSKEPDAALFAAELPDREKVRAGLETHMRLWVILEEYNTDVVGQSYYLPPDPPLGQLGKAFFLPLLREFVARRKSLRSVPRG